MNQPSASLIRSCQSGDAEAFCDIVGLYEKPLFGYVYRMLWGTRHRQDAEDVVQEVFLKAYSHIGTFSSSSGAQFSTWLFSIARNHCLSLLRKRADPYSICTDPEELENLSASACDSREAASQGETVRRLACAISALDEDQRSALILRCYEEMSYEEIAATLDCSVGTAKSRVSRARDKLAAELKDLL